MERVNGYYLYQVGAQIHPILDFRAEHEPNPMTYEQIWLQLYAAESALDVLLNQSVLRLKTSQNSGNALLAEIRKLRNKCQNKQVMKDTLAFPDYYTVKTHAQNFEAVLAAELGIIDLYIVLPKGGLDTSALITAGELTFPALLQVKVPESIDDVRQATRCIAFELPTAAGFHLHRANESVIGRYWDHVTGGDKRPQQRNIGVYLTQMDKKNAGRDEIKSALRDIKNLHRNPLIHPEHTLKSVDEAISLMGAIRSVVGFMLDEIPTPPGPRATNLSGSSTGSP